MGGGIFAENARRRPVALSGRGRAAAVDPAGPGARRDRGLRMAADAEDAQALHSLAFEYSEGEILHQENSKALEYLQKACDAGNYYSMGTLGLLYYDGDFLVSKDYDKAFYYLHEAAGHPQEFGDDMLGSIYRNLAACYRFGRGTEINHSLASYYTEQAAKCGDSSSFEAVNALRKQ